jgi:RHS repeat-associated protein
MKIYFMPAWQELMSTGGNGREQLSYSAGGVPEEWQWYPGNDAYQQTHLDNRLGFAGYVWDPWLKVYHVRHRVYDPFDTRWLQADPIGYAGGDTDLRRYCNGDPVNFVDPLGLWGTRNPAPADGGGAGNSGPMTPSWIHNILDVVGFFPVVGTVADVANGGLYAIDGEWDEAGLSLVGALPIVGDVIAGARKGIKAVDKIDDAVDAAKGAEGAKGVDNAEDAASKAGNPKKPDDADKPAGGAEGGSGCGEGGSRGSTVNPEKGTHNPSNLREQLAIDEARANPGAGEPITFKNDDPRWPKEEGWTKMWQNHNDIEVHYQYNKRTGQVDDLKIIDKSRDTSSKDIKKDTP